MKRRGPGRPPKPKSKKQAELISVRLTPSEKRAITAQAKRERVSVSSLVRRAMFATD